MVPSMPLLYQDLLRGVWHMPMQLDPLATEQCAKCGQPEKEHHYNGACYGACGQFVPPVSSDQEDEWPEPHVPQIAKTPLPKGTTSPDQIAVLKAARTEVDRLAAEIKQEMADKGNEGHLWTNGMCRAWPAYEKAHARLTVLREEYGV